MSVETVIQAGGFGVLVLLLFGLGLGAKLAAPSIKEFLLSLVADLKANTAALNTMRETMLVEVRAVVARVDLAEERIKAHTTATASGVEEEVRDAAKTTGEHVVRTGEHMAMTVSAAVEIARQSGTNEADYDMPPRRPSPPTPMRGFPALRPPPPPSSRGHRRSVLIVEDDPTQARAIRQCLVSAIDKLIVTLAHSSGEALSALGVASVTLPNVAVIDCNLPDGYGWELANRAPRSVQIILMSGHVDATMLSKLASGVKAEWLKKPIDMDELIGLVRDRLEASEGV